MKNYLLKNSDRFGWGRNKLTPNYKIKELLPLIQGKKILDVGCGPGHLVNFLSKKGFNAHGTDICPEFIQFATKNYLGKFSISNVYNLPFKDKEFDTVLILNVLEHLKNDKKALQEILRVGKNIIISVPHKAPSILKDRGLIYSHYQDKSHLRNYTVKSLKKIFSATNIKSFEIKKIEKMHTKSIFFELFQAPTLLRRVITKIFFTIFKEKNFYLELLAIIKT